MKNYLFILIFAASIFSTSAGKLLSAEPARPNILYFYVDDMGWGSIGPNGQETRKQKGLPYVQTPNIDQLATQGINFTRGYGCHVCSPARSSQQSGFHQGHTFADRNDPNNAKKAMRADDVLMGDALSSAGYVTGYWGKWGYGGSKDRANPVIENVQTLPTSHGYQFALAELHHVRAHTFFQPTLWSAPATAKSVGGMQLVANSLARYKDDPTYPSTPAFQDHADYPKTAYCDDAYAFATLDFVREQGQNYNKTGQPFFGLLACQIPHAPFGEVAKLPKWNDAYAKDANFASLAEQSQQWAAMVTRIDAHFANILAALDDPNNDGDTSDSIADNTLVIFQSDNGGPGGKNNVELNANGGLRGQKGSIQEGGIRVPLVMRWPAKINNHSPLKAGSNCNMVVDVTDLLPTFCELAGVSAPLGVDGVSIAPTLRGAGRQRQREFIIHEAGNGQSIIRGNYKLVRSGKTPKLYDLDADHAEKNDIAEDHPQSVKELHALLLGERVAEPRGFATTYHHWVGANNGKASDADNWSDYQYSNAGVTYMTDAGAPQLSWIARLENQGKQSRTAIADADLEFLGLEIKGNAAKNARQSLVVGQGVNLTGRNEIRLASHGTLKLNGGAASSLRWVEVLPGGELTGSGKINAKIYNSGSVAVSSAKQPALKITGDFLQMASGALTVAIAGDKPVVNIAGEATLAGQLTATLTDGFKPVAGDSYVVLAAENITGKFANPHNEVVADDGVRFTIGYTKTNVTLTVK